MSQHNKAPKAHLTTVAEFPKNYFLENLAVRSDNSIRPSRSEEHTLNSSHSLLSRMPSSA